MTKFTNPHHGCQRFFSQQGFYLNNLLGITPFGSKENPWFVWVFFFCEPYQVLYVRRACEQTQLIKLQRRLHLSVKEDLIKFRLLSRTSEADSYINVQVIEIIYLFTSWRSHSLTISKITTLKDEEHQ